METNPHSNLLGMDRTELEQFAIAQGQPRFRGHQLYRAMYTRRERDFSNLTDLSRSFRDELSSNYRISYPEIKGKIASSDGSVRYLLALDDSETIETVYMPEENRVTLCLSSQAGCAVDCRFCFTALLGVKRNLTAGEMAGQALAVMTDQEIPRRFRLNVVFMGMGEPLLNLREVMKAVGILSDPEGLGISLHRITVSTAGIAPKIYAFARELRRPKLAISLNASTEKQRTALMPINQKYTLAQLIEACRVFPLRPRERLTFEYVMLDGVNDSDADAARVVELLEGIHAKVNLIPYNAGPDLPYRSSPLDRVLAFQQVLTDHKLPTFIRISRGRDIMAACGQLSLASADAAPAPLHIP